MSMPTKGKHHHLGHHHHQNHHPHLQAQHILGVNINQSTTPTVSHSSHSQHYNPAILNSTSRFVPHSGTDFHVSGQNFGAQSGGQVGGGGSSLGVSAGRGPPLGGAQSIGQSATGIVSGVSSSGPPQPTPGTSIQPQPSQGPGAATVSVHNQSPQEMGKQSHLQTQPTAMQQVFVQNPNRSTSQNFYASGPRPQQPRNLNHRNVQPGSQGQVVGMAGVGASSGQPTALYPHPSIAMQPSAMYVQGQVSSIHTNPHQQNVYSMNNQMPMQFSGPPQRHQTHQNQFPYQSFPTHALLTTSNLYGYPHGTQHPSFFYHQTPNAQVNLSRAGANTVNSGTQHISGPLTGSQAASMVPQGSIQQQAQQPQTIHSMNLTLSQTNLNFGFNSSHATTTTRSKNRIYDIVNPATGKNISADIYKNDIPALCENSTNRSSPQPISSNPEVAADFAARVAKLASADSESSSLLIGVENFSVCSQDINQDLSLRPLADDCSKPSQYDNNSPSPTSTSTSTVNLEKPNFDTELQLEKKTDPVATDEKRSSDALTSTILENVLMKAQDPIQPNIDTIPVLPETKEITVSDSQKTEINVDCASVVNRNTENQLTDICYFMKEQSDRYPQDKIDSNEVTSILIPQSSHDDPLEKANGDTDVKEIDLEVLNETQQKIIDGKTMQKQKNKNKVKSRELNRKGAEKEGTDMDAFVNPIQISASPVKIEMKQDDILQRDINEGSVESLKDIKEKDNYESKKEKDISDFHKRSNEKSISNMNDSKELLQKQINREDSAEDVVADESIKKDVSECITVYRTKVEKELVLPTVAQKNEENSKVSELCNTSKQEDLFSTGVVSVVTSATSTSTPSLKYTYLDDQWSPINTNGKKIYGRDFLMKLQNDPNSKIKPSNLPDLDVVLKDNTKTRSPVDLRFKDANLGRHDSLFPGFVKSSLSAKVPPPNKKSHSGKPKTSKPNVIHVSLSLREDVKLRETENAWKPTRLVQGSISEEQAKTDALYKRVRSVLNKLTPQKFETLVNQVRELQIDTQERLQGVIDLVFEKAVDEPNFSVAYALMCKELSNMEVTGADSEDSSSANFRKLILTRCQTEFEKNTVDENARCEKLKEIEECSDPERKKELQLNIDEEERRLRIKSVGNIRFIGELFKQNMLRCKIMHQCIKHLLGQADEENLECLCKLLTTIGKVLESKNIDLSDYFNQMQQIANRKGKISSRIRFMLQDVIDLRTNKWIPRRDDSNPKTMDQIQREAESERLDIQLNNVSLSTPRKDERSNERKRNRGGTGSTEDGGWSQPVGRPRQQVYSVETSKLKNKPPSMDDMQLGSRATYQWKNPNAKMTTPNKFSYLENITPEPDKRVPNIHLSGSRSTGPRDYGRSEYKSNYDGRSSRNGSYQMSSSSYNRDNTVIESSRSQSLSLMSSSKFTPQTTVTASNAPQLSVEEFQTASDTFLEEYVTEDGVVEEAVKVFRSTFPASVHASFVQETINTVLEKNDNHRNKTSQLLAQLLNHKCISLSHFKTGLGAILEAAGDLIIDIPKLWKYFAEILVHSVINNAHPLSEFKSTIQTLSPKLRNDGHGLELIAALLSEIKNSKGTVWASDNWEQSGLRWSDFIDNQTKIDQIITEYKLEFLTEDHCMSFNNDDIASLRGLLKDSNFDDICIWIQTKVGNRVKDPKFIRVLMTAILETSVEQCNDKWTFKVETFDKLQKLIQRYVDAEAYLELQCLFAVQAYITKLSHPAGLIVKIMTYLCENNVLSNEAFLAWEKNEDPAEREGKSVALLSLKSFFTPLKEFEDNSSGDEA